MRTYALICTRTKQLSKTTQTLTSYLSRCGVEVKLIVNSKSIFSGYSRAFKQINPDPSDIFILCHDDIEILSQEGYFLPLLFRELSVPKTGFIGPAGTTELNSRAVWWDQDQWAKGKHSGMVFHGEELTSNVNPTFYGAYRNVAILDGLFLAAKARVLMDVGLDKPDYLEGEWDFYDIHYTATARKKGYSNRAVPVLILHNSSGELAGRDSWHKNRELFILKFDRDFPITA
ncbi:hypothetical protein CMI47_19940 [Candidatus Pacearchaeota archaeon]|nr:hypothetical protein [Candidatus Pacearchaeota archaeon]|tara:strand:+ start:3217 stop:3909 length:693 start_codon:yes stop_codon:yes gene_type:complete